MKKKLLSLVLAAILLAGLAVNAAASMASGNKITDIVAPIDKNNPVNLDTIRAGTVLRFPLTADMFSWSDGVTYTSDTPVTKAQLSSANITLRSTTLDSSIFDSAEILTSSTNQFSVANGAKTAYVQVKFVEDFVSVGSKEFTASFYLAVKSNRDQDSRLTLNGVFENEIVNANSNTSYVDLSAGKVLEPSEYIRELDIGLGNGVMIRTRVYANRKYYGIARELVTESDDAVLRKYPAIQTIVVLKTVNLNTSGNIVHLEGYENYHVYDANGKYLGSSNNAVPYSNKYYLSENKIDMGGGIASTSSGSSSSSSSASSSTGSGSTPNTAGAAITTETAKSRTATAASTARANGLKTATVRFTDAASISAAALKAMPGSAGGLAVSLVADTMSGTAVVGRLTINPALATNLTKDTLLGVYVDSGHTGTTKTKFEKYYKNRIAVVSLAQQGSYGMTVRIAAKVNLSSFTTTSLKFYSFNKSTNKYAQITNPAYSIDANGYLHFSTIAAGDIIITDSALTLK